MKLVNYWPIRIFLHILKVSFAVYQVPPELEIIMLVTLGTKSPFLCAQSGPQGLVSAFLEVPSLPVSNQYNN